MFVFFNKEFRPRTSLSLSILESILQNEGHQTRLFDTSFYSEFMEDWTMNSLKSGVFNVVKNLDIPVKISSAYNDLKKLILEFQPDIIGFTFYTMHIEMQATILKPLKEEFPNIKIIAGGPHVCIKPEAAIKESYIDMICYGEGETLIKELCAKLDRGEDISQITGLWIKDENGCIIRNGLTQLTDINIIPIPNWDSFDNIQIFGLFDGRAFRMGHVEFTRGCPFDCTYCGSGSIKMAYSKDGQKKYVRHKDPEIAVKEYETLKNKYNLEMLYFVDGTFTSMPKKILRILSALYKERVNLPFIALVNPVTIDREVAELLSKMGCIHVSIGIESGIESYREKVFNRKMSNKKIIDAVRFLRENGIHVSAYNIIGMPGMDRKHVFETIKLNRLAQVDSAIVSIFVPIPGAKITRSLIEKGLIDPDNIRIADGSTPTLEIKDMTKAEIEGLYNTFNLYLRVPEEFYPLIRILEFSNPLTNFIRKFLLYIMWIARK